MSQYQNVADVLTIAKQSIAELLHDQPHHALRLTHALQREINYITLTTGTIQEAAAQPEKITNAQTIAGEPIHFATAGVKPEELELEQTEVDKLRHAVEVLHSKFLNLAASEILKDYDDIVVRGVAKKAGLKVTSDEPKKLTNKFVESVKEAITNNATAHQAKVEAATRKLNDLDIALANRPPVEEDEADQRADLEAQRTEALEVLNKLTTGQA